MNVNKCSRFLRCYTNKIRNTLDFLVVNVNELRNALDFLDSMQMKQEILLIS